jgi:lysophospholipase L1-like esterase
MRNKIILAALCILACSSFIVYQTSKPVFYIIGDSTVRNGDGSGKNQQWGWGSFIANYFDTTKIGVQNHAIGGRSSRTFITEGRWNRILENLKKDDYVIMQFGHNDGGPLDDTSRARGTIRGIGEDSVATYNPIRKVNEVVHSFGWYMRKYIRDTKERGAIPIVCSPIPRNDWKDGKVIRSSESYSKWAEQVATEEGAYFINLNDDIAVKYESMGQETVKPFFPVDHTHTNLDGAKLNAEIVIDGIKKLKIRALKRLMN